MRLTGKGFKLEKEAVAEGKIRWALWIPAIAALGFVMNTIQGLTHMGGYGCIYGLGTVSIPFSMPILMLLLPLFLSPLTFGGRIKISKTTLGRLCIVGLLTTYTINATAYVKEPWGFINRVYYSAADIRDLWVPMWYTASYEAVVRTRLGGVLPDWGAWAGSAIWYILYQTAYFLLGSSLMMLLRRRWIEVERLPFPFALATWQAVEETHRIKKPKIGTPFILGVIVGFAINTIILLTYVFPWWPDILSWRANGVSPNGCVAVRTDNPIGSVVVGFMRWNMQPLNYAIAYLAPLNVSFGMWFMTLVMMLLAQIAYYFGYYTGFQEVGGCCRALALGGFATSAAWGPPLYWNWMCLTGGMLGFVLMILWQARPYLRETIAAVRSGKSSGVDESKETMSYKGIYAMIGISSVFLLAFLFSTGIGLPVGIVMLIFGGGVYAIAEAYARGVAGVAYGQGRDQWPTWPLRFLFWPVAPERFTIEYFMSVTIIADGLDQPASGQTAWTTASMYAFKLADLSGLSAKTAYKLMAVTFAITLLTHVIVSLTWINLVGQARSLLCTPGWECDIAGRERYNTAPPVDQIAMAAVAGFVIVTGLFFMHSRYVWWPIHPMGFLLSGGMYIVWTGVWSCFLVAWVFKYATLRIGGSRAYEQYGVPFVGGTLVGLVITVVVGVILGAVRFFFPF